MSIIKTIPPEAKFFTPVVRFTAEFNNPTLGKYDFDTLANKDVVILENLLPNSIYMIDRISFSATVPEMDYQDSIENIPNAIFKFAIDKNRNLYEKPFYFPDYQDGKEAIAFFHNNHKDEKLICDFRGVLDQVANFAGVSEIKTQLTLEIYNIRDQHWISEFKSGSRVKNAKLFEVF